jgi:hypothetical protein
VLRVEKPSTLGFCFERRGKSLPGLAWRTIHSHSHYFPYTRQGQAPAHWGEEEARPGAGRFGPQVLASGWRAPITQAQSRDLTSHIRLNCLPPSGKVHASPGPPYPPSFLATHSIPLHSIPPHRHSSSPPRAWCLFSIPSYFPLWHPPSSPPFSSKTPKGYDVCQTTGVVRT